MGLRARASCEHPMLWERLTEAAAHRWETQPPLSMTVNLMPGSVNKAPMFGENPHGPA
jgi:hypothetical protein